MYNMHLAFSNTYLLCLHIYYPEQALFCVGLVKMKSEKKTPVCSSICGNYQSVVISLVSCLDQE